jgi:hypothetical protein
MVGGSNDQRWTIEKKRPDKDLKTTRKGEKSKSWTEGREEQGNGGGADYSAHELW